MPQRVKHHTAARRFLIILLLTLPVILSNVALAQTEEEKTALQMFYSEDTLVTAPTRTPKPLSKVAENISIVTAEEIEAMNAHTIEEVLEMVAGVFVYYQRNDFWKASYFFIQGTDLGNEERHVLVLLDNVPWNFLAGGNPDMSTIPVGIIKRIEIIKGPASSVWGSSLGGVINIVTKDTGDTVVPSGTVSASFGERRTRDYNGAVAGKAGTVGYYLYAGRQDSDGFRRERFFERDSFYGKIDIPFNQDTKLLLTAGYSDPHANQGDYIEAPPETNPAVTRAFFTTAALSVGLTDELRLEAACYEFRQKYAVETNDLFSGELHYRNISDEKYRGASAKLIWSHDIHNAVLGWDISHGKDDNRQDYGIIYGGPLTFVEHPGISKWAVFANDTISLGDLSLTPAIRHDQNNVNGDFTSPSLGATYKLGSRTLLKASVAKGFTNVPLALIAGNDSFKPEKVWSYQAGAESRVTDYLSARGSLFHHDMKDFIIFDNTASRYVNKGKSNRHGIELDVETIPIYNTSLKAGFSYVRNKLSPEDILAGLDPNLDTTKNIYDYNVVVKYDDMKSFKALLTGNYTWWDLESSEQAKYNSFIWNANLDKKIYSSDKIKAADVFLTVHNIFNGSYYVNHWWHNPRRWMEAGLRMKF